MDTTFIFSKFQFKMSYYPPSLALQKLNGLRQWKILTSWKLNSVWDFIWCLVNLNLIYETLWTGVKSGLFISMQGKLDWFRLTSLMRMLLLMWKWMGVYLKKNNILRCWCYKYVYMSTVSFLAQLGSGILYP